MIEKIYNQLLNKLIYYYLEKKKGILRAGAIVFWKEHN